MTKSAQLIRGRAAQAAVERLAEGERQARAADSGRWHSLSRCTRRYVVPAS